MLWIVLARDDMSKSFWSNWKTLHRHRARPHCMSEDNGMKASGTRKENKNNYHTITNRPPSTKSLVLI